MWLFLPDLWQKNKFYVCRGIAGMAGNIHAEAKMRQS